MTSFCFLPKTCIAIGTVLAKPDKNNDQPSAFRRSPLNLSASSRPAPKPMAPRVAAISASSGTVTLLGSEIFTFSLLTQPQSGNGVSGVQHTGSVVVITSSTCITFLPQDLN